MRKLTCLALTFILATLFGCGDKTSSNRLDKSSPNYGAPGTIGGTSSDEVAYVSGDDKEMNAAMDKARATVDAFTAVFAKPAANQNGFTVKKKYPTKGGGFEYIWLTDLKFDGKEFVGKVGNDPDLVPNLKLGDAANVGVHDITDWMYFEDGAVVGGFTLRVLLKTAKGAEAEELKSMKFKD